MFRQDLRRAPQPGRPDSATPSAGDFAAVIGSVLTICNHLRVSVHFDIGRVALQLREYGSTRRLRESPPGRRWWPWLQLLINSCQWRLCCISKMVRQRIRRSIRNVGFNGCRFVSFPSSLRVALQSPRGFVVLAMVAVAAVVKVVFVVAVMVHAAVAHVADWALSSDLIACQHSSQQQHATPPQQRRPTRYNNAPTTAATATTPALTRPQRRQPAIEIATGIFNNTATCDAPPRTTTPTIKN